ncbi:hypothetical protein DLJ47_29130 [Micromonospora sp. S4605]|uniref:winged helix-turn-helix domain-containing protein n=1 Tax=Micromonospora sp. S4605 TaxID=1420897 RepID=UPI000D6FC356|nr:hypothetical protein DLJ47_29130 [Micromonospora sp. S4605]
MSVVAISPRPYPPGRLDRSAPYRRPATTSLTITVDLAPGEPSPRLARLLELLGELATSGEGRLVPAAGGDPSAGRAPAGRREVDVHVRRLRAKLGARTPVVTTVYGVGYRLADEARIEIDRAR